ncbi:radical SAM/SPASM domain-containing protein [Desulfovirgula thermocuniculi]|uniref:radical SAM/SPASM domain-containing protein n=1 Tax=Desulfovirgula thermocuniculi TaxID=348842 RepID=UPI001FE0DC07|nr:radical SAM protein [Desulfovirgula thermocuniculi]
MVTLDCNLRCLYCYAQGGEKKEYMSWEVARQAIDFVASRSKYFKVQFTGGEPLLNWPLVEMAVRYIRERRLPAAVQLQTNATLITSSMARKIKALGLALGVSLDGPPEVNDLTRPFAGGGGSTLAVINGLQNLAAEGIKVGLTAVLTERSVSTLGRLVELASYLGNVYGLSLDLLRPLGRGRSKEVKPPNPELLEQNVRSAFRRAEEIVKLGGPLVRFREVERIRLLMARGFSREYSCHAAAGQSLAVMPDGSLYPCASLCGLEEFYLGRVTAKGLSLGRLASVESILSSAGIDSCHRCPQKHLCGGGCPARAYAYARRVEEIYQVECRLKKVFLALAKEGEKHNARGKDRWR